MFRTLSLVVLACSFGFLLLGLTGYAISPKLLNATEIRRNAEEAVPSLALPEKPAGQTVLVPTTQNICTTIPEFRGFKILSKNICVDQAGPPIEKFVGPTDLEMQNWELEVERIQRERTALLELEIAKIENSQQILFTAYIKDLIQISSSILEADLKVVE